MTNSAAASASHWLPSLTYNHRRLAKSGIENFAWQQAAMTTNLLEVTTNGILRQ